MKSVFVLALLWCTLVTAFGQNLNTGTPLTPEELKTNQDLIKEAKPASSASRLSPLVTKQGNKPAGYQWESEWNPKVWIAYRYHNGTNLDMRFKGIVAIVEECDATGKVLKTYGIVFDTYRTSPKKSLHIALTTTDSWGTTVRITFYDPISKEKAVIQELPKD